MLNNKISKANYEICLKCKYQLKHKTISTEKMLLLTKSALNSTFYA